MGVEANRATRTEPGSGSGPEALQGDEQLRREREAARTQLRQAQHVVAYLLAQVGEAGRTLEATEHHLHAIAKTKPYRLAHFLRRLERDFFKGSWNDRRGFITWLIRRLGGRQLPVAERKNPLLTWPAPTATVRNYRAQLYAILQAHRDKPVIVSRPIVDWDLPLFQRPHHLARQLAELGFLYFFCRPKWGKDTVDGFAEVGPGCFVTDQVLLLETLTGRVTHLLSTDNSCDLDYVRYRQSAGDLVLYEYIDHIHQAVSGRAIPDETWARHHALLADESIVCIATADQLLSEVRAVRRRNFALVTNGVDIDHFAPVGAANPSPPDEIRAVVGQGKPIIGYFGAFASWFDYELVERAARERPQYEWLLIGVNYDGSIDRTTLRRLPNVTILGPIAYQVLPRYGSYFDVATIPFLRNEITLSTSPIKLFEYMALGKPIVTTDIPECRKYRSCLVATSHGEFVQRLDRALEIGKSPQYLATLREEAAANSWAKKATDIAVLLRDNLEPHQLVEGSAPNTPGTISDSGGVHQGVANQHGDPADGYPSAAPSRSQFLFPATDAEIVAFTAAVQRTQPSSYEVICFPGIATTVQSPRPQELLVQFAAAGHHVYDLSPHFLPDGLPYELDEVAANFRKVSLRMRPLNGDTDRLDDVARDELFAVLDTLRRQEGIGAAIAYAQSPFWWPLLERLRAEFAWPILYDRMDEHGRFPANRHQALKDAERLLRGADLLLEDHPTVTGARSGYEGVAALVPAVRDTFPLASIVIVTYNNLPLNRLCLHSLYAHTDWPNFEVIVVDNASTDGTPAYLKEAEQQFPRMRVVLNEANLGFAAANNIGLQMAQGDYLVLLNNDTVLVRGWLSTLIRHLAADPTIGLIGPVTNEIANEAKVPVSYRHLEDMPVWAAEFTRRQDGHLFDIPMLAMFCIAMRRATFTEIGLLDEQFGIGMFEDDDYSLRVRKSGYRVVCAGDAFVHHFGCAAFKQLMESGAYQRLFTENRQRYEAKWNIGWTPHQAAI